VKVKPSVKKICNKCRVIRRHGRVMIICDDPRHKQRQGWQKGRGPSYGEKHSSGRHATGQSRSAVI